MNIMLSSVVIIALLYTLTFTPSSANFPCTTYESGRSGSNDDDITTVKCTTTYPTMVSCGCRTHWSTEDQMDGCHQNSDATVCTAINGLGGNGVYAIARCCKFATNDVQCVGIDSGFVDGDDATVSIDCGQSSHHYLTGCSAFSAWTVIDGSYPNIHNPFAVSPIPNSDYRMDGYCTAHNGGSVGSGKGTSAQAVCCDSPTYALQCVLRYGNKASGTGQKSMAHCGAGYTMTGCSGFGAYRNINAWYVTSSTGICQARTYNYREIQAVGICCRMETDAPTTDPTKVPTPAPTLLPTVQPTKNPSKIPTISPTKPPTNIPTVNPSNNPTKFPTNNPSVFPTKLPTNDPSKSPTKTPTKIPTKTPTKTPTKIPTKTPTNLAINATQAQIIRIPVPVPSDNSNSAAMGGLIGALVFLVLCMCCLGILFLVYLWRKNKKLNEEVNVAQGGENILSTAPPIYPVEGTSATTTGIRQTSTSPKGYNVLEQSEDPQTMIASSNTKIKSDLIADDSSDDEENLNAMYDRKNSKTKGKQVIYLDDEDEDILPNDDDDNDDMLR